MFLAAKEFPLPDRVPLPAARGGLPRAAGRRRRPHVVFLDCGNIDRMPVDFLQRDGATILNIDHHHDNTRFGTVNLVDADASCTAEIVFDLAERLGVELTPEIAEALYVGLVTDTGQVHVREHRRRARTGWRPS